MRIKKVVKRLVALSAGATMLGATVMGAMAADLSSYPGSFHTDGVFNGYFVVGEAAKPIDNLAMTDIATSMWYTKAADDEVVTVEGDAWKVGTSTKMYEMANTNSTPVGEQIYDIERWIGKDELDALADGTYSTNAGDYSYTQYLYFDTGNNNQNEIVVYRENDNDVTADFFFAASSANIGEYKLEFSSSPESTIQTTAGSASTTGEVLDDFENTKITFFGQEYDVVLARRPQTTPEDSIKLTLMGGAVSGSLLEGESQSYDLNGESFEVSLTYTDSTYAKFTVNGETTNKLQVGDTYKLASGKEIGVSEVLYQAYAGGVHSAKFFLGASKMELRDNDITDTAGGTEMVVGSETIDGADVIITGTDDNTTFRLNTIQVNMTAQDNYFVPADGKLSDAIIEQGDEEEVLFTNNWDIEYKGLDASVATHEVKLYSTTDRKYKLQFYDGDGNKVAMPLFYANTTTDVQWTEDGTKQVVLYETFNISKNDYFVLTGGTAADGTAKSYAMQYKGADKSTSTSPKVKFKNLATGETLEYALNTATGDVMATIKLGGYSFNVENYTAKTAGDPQINVDQSGDGTSPSAAQVDIIDYYGMQINFGSVPTTDCDTIADCSQASVVMTLTTPNSNDYDNQAPPKIDLTVDGNTNTEVSFGTLQLDDSNHNLLTPEGEENIAYGYTTMGGKLTYKTPSGSPAEFIYEYPENQRLPQVYVTSGATTTTIAAGGELALIQVVDATKLDNEVADKGAQNLVVVGGPCVNNIAAELLGSPADCTEGFSPGKARVKIFDTGAGNLAMLVAGYSGDDTRLAGKVVAHRYSELSGEEVEVAGTTYSDATIGAPTVVEETVVEETAAEETAAEETTTD